MIENKNEQEQKLIVAIKKIRKDRNWLNNYFDLIKETFLSIGVFEDSPKITMSITKDLKMPISIGQRYIISYSFRKDIVGFILPIEFREILADYDTATVEEAYFFNKKKKQEALWVEFNGNIIMEDDNSLYKSWINAAKTELNKTKQSGFRRSHNPFYYKAVMDNDYRQFIFEETHG